MCEVNIEFNSDCCPACHRHGTLKEMLYRSPKGCLNHVMGEDEYKSSIYEFDYCKEIGGLYYCEFCGNVRVVINND